MTDPIADYLTRIRNAILAHHDSVEIPASKLKIRITEILKGEGFVKDFQLLDDRRQGLIHIDLKWNTPKENAIIALKRESRPGQRRYVKAKDIPRVLNGLGVSIISTSSGLLTDGEARKRGVGGEYICSVW
jgi:small subunit ribosomal protein S8